MTSHSSHKHNATVKIPDIPHAQEQCAEQGLPRHHSHGFKGYTLEELKYRKAVTRLKIDLTTERLRLYCNPRLKEEVQTVSGYVQGFENVMRYIDYAMVAYNISRKIGNFMGRFSRSKK